MAHISLDEAAIRSGILRQELEAWAKQGLLTFHEHPRPAGDAPGPPTVDEDELERVVESMGWLHLSARAWDTAEED